MAQVHSLLQQPVKAVMELFLAAVEVVEVVESLLLQIVEAVVMAHMDV